MYDTEWGERLRFLRIMAGYSQEQAAITVGVPGATFAQWENKGREPRDKQNYNHLAELFNVSKNVIVGAEKIKTPLVWIPSNYEQRQSDAIRDAIRDELPKLLDIDKAVAFDLNKKGTCYLLNNKIILVAGEDIEGVVNKVIPEEMLVKADLNLGVGPKEFGPVQIEQIAAAKMLSTELGTELAVKSLKIPCTGIRKALSVIPDAKLRHAAASELIPVLYPQLDRVSQNWAAFYVANPENK